MNKNHILLTEELVNKLDVVEIISGYVNLKRNGRGYEGNCPFHLDTKRSLKVTPKTQTWICVNDCQGSRRVNDAAHLSLGNVMSFVSGVEGDSFGRTVRKLSVQHGLTLQNDIVSRAPNCLEGPMIPKAKNPLSKALPIGAMTDWLELDRSFYPEWARSELRIGSLAFQGRLTSRVRFSRHFEYGPGIEGQPRPGLVMALHSTLEDHCELEYPDGSRQLLDRLGVHDAGEVLKADYGQASAIIKDRATGSHFEIPVLAVSTAGFCLFTPPGLEVPCWCWPEGPPEPGARRRSFKYRKGVGDSDVSEITMESFSADASLITKYEDISGKEVKVFPADRGTRTHNDLT